MEKKGQSKNKNPQQTQPKCDNKSMNWTWTTAMGDKCSHHFTIPMHSLLFPVHALRVFLIRKLGDIEKVLSLTVTSNF